MKTIYKLAITELQILFYSPIAWLIIVIFTVQLAMNFVGTFEGTVKNLEFGYGAEDITNNVYSGMRGLFNTVQSYLYLYLPLLTMGLMSRELGSGSIKLLYSSPVTNSQIILGKFLSMMIYGLILMAIVFVFVLFGLFNIENVDWPALLSGMLGLYLLICAYSAIGLFMSSLTSYQVVAAICTLTMLAVLNYVRGWWQDVAFVRDITYWLSISGRSNEFISGLICSEDVLYFIIVVALFLFLAIIRLQACRQKSPWTVTWGKYLGVFCIAMLLGYLSSRPKLMTFYDATYTKRNTLTPNSQEMISKLKGGLTITTYTNLFDSHNLWNAIPISVNTDLRRFQHYTRFKPEIKMKYVYYYDTIPGKNMNNYFPELKTLEEKAKKTAERNNLNFKLFLSPEEFKKQVDLLPVSNNGFVRKVERENGQFTWLRIFDDMQKYPSEREITAALKRLVMQSPKVGFLHGHGERDNTRDGDRNYRRFAQERGYRYALSNQGFDVTDVNLNEEIPADVNILVIAEMRSALTEREQQHLDQYIQRGDNLLIMGEPRRREFMDPLVERFGVRFVPGVLVKEDLNFPPDLTLTISTREARELSYPYGGTFGRALVTMPTAAGLEWEENGAYKVTPLFRTDSICWNELETTDFVDDTVRLNPAAGEVQKAYITALALSKQVGEKEQRIVIFGDADCISNGEIERRRNGIWTENFSVINGSFFWLSNNEVPIDVRRPGSIDNTVRLGLESMTVWGIVLKWVLPALLALIAIVVWIRRRGR